MCYGRLCNCGILLGTLSAGAKQPVHSFLGSKGLGIQQGMSVWVGSSKSDTFYEFLYKYRHPNLLLVHPNVEY